jgi:hypothetical protein
MRVKLTCSGTSSIYVLCTAFPKKNSEVNLGPYVKWRPKLSKLNRNEIGKKKKKKVYVGEDGATWYTGLDGILFQ